MGFDPHLWLHDMVGGFIKLTTSCVDRWGEAKVYPNHWKFEDTYTLCLLTHLKRIKDGDFKVMKSHDYHGMMQ